MRARRAQVWALALTGLIVLWQLVGLPGVAAPKELAHRALAPVERLLGRGPDRVADLAAANAELASSVAVLRSELAAARQVPGVTALAATVNARAVPARVVGQDDLLGLEPGIVTIGAGSADGVALDRSVVTAAGLVGTVVRVSAHTADVSLLTNPEIGVSARVGAQGRLGSVTGARDEQPGRTAGQLSLELLDPGPVAVGDVVTTLGSAADAPYPPGLPIGTVVSVDPLAGGFTATAAVEPAADLATLDVVAVLIPA